MRPRRLSIWAPLSPGVYTRSAKGTLPYPLEESNHRLFSRARHGLWHGLRALGLGPGDTVLVPAYHHGSEIEALIRAGIGCRYYEITESLQPDERELSALLDPSVRALYLIHYFGVPQDAQRWRAWCDAHNVLMIEDAAMAFLSSWEGRPIGSFGDLAIYCIYKTFGLPDGAALISAVPAAGPTSRGRLGAMGTAFRHGSWLAQGSAVLATIHAHLRKTSDPEGEFELGDPTVRPSAATVRLLRRVVTLDAAARRRGNYACLLKHLSGHVQCLFETIPSGASPTAFLIVMEPPEQARLRERLGRAGIRPANFWQVPHPTVPETGFERSRFLRANVIGLPVHQEVPKAGLERIVRSVRSTKPG
jgi:dTDP-4-amino-4,6-dideoxygalactose transaminase